MTEECYTITAVHSIDGGEALVAEARAQYKSDFPGRSARRMTHLGMLVTLCMRELDVQKHIPMIYASAFGESESLEKFIDSFPTASPALFQTSIHPSAAEQGLIPNQTAIDRFYPITCHINLPAKALENCIVLSDDEVILIGGEEKGTWLCEHRLASDRSFAYGLRLKRGEHDGVGRLLIEPKNEHVTCASMDSLTFAQALMERRPFCLASSVLAANLLIEWL